MKTFNIVLKNIFCSYLKNQKVLKHLRRKSYKSALNKTYHMKTRLASIIWQGLRSLFSNIFELGYIDIGNLVLKEIFLTKARIIKKFFPRAKGKTDIRKKRFSHLNIILSLN